MNFERATAFLIVILAVLDESVGSRRRIKKKLEEAGLLDRDQKDMKEVYLALTNLLCDLMDDKANCKEEADRAFQKGGTFEKKLLRCAMDYIDDQRRIITCNHNALKNEIAKICKRLGSKDRRDCSEILAEASNLF